MDLQELNEIKKRYDANKAENEKAQRMLENSKQGMTKSAYEFSEAMAEYLNANFKRKWIKWLNPNDPDTEFYKFAIAFHTEGRNVTVLCSQEVDVSYKNMPPKVKHFRYSECFPMTMDCKDCALGDFSLEPVDEEKINAFIKLAIKASEE